MVKNLIFLKTISKLIKLNNKIFVYLNFYYYLCVEIKK